MDKILLFQIMKYVLWNPPGRIFNRYGGNAIITRWPYTFSCQCATFVPKIRQAQSLTRKTAY
ncbi:hypothetical protein [Candidatus Nitrotoga arctica]|uniref:hypothetical protein n=1 Tax=Candidatus Nitrotoga arctica TaxID=453162 RepID=UPI001EFB4A2B|nr:hypothetical protein [Candidatus Nitrotoga arctica]